MSEHMRKARADVPGLSEALRSIDDVERSSDTPDAQEPQVRCNNCGAALPARRKPKSFCNYACRGQFRVVKATGHRTGLIGSKNNSRVLPGAVPAPRHRSRRRAGHRHRCTTRDRGQEGDGETGRQQCPQAGCATMNAIPDIVMMRIALTERGRWSE